MWLKDGFFFFHLVLFCFILCCKNAVTCRSLDIFSGSLKQLHWTAARIEAEECGRVAEDIIPPYIFKQNPAVLERFFYMLFHCVSLGFRSVPRSFWCWSTERCQLWRTSLKCEFARIHPSWTALLKGDCQHSSLKWVFIQCFHFFSVWANLSSSCDEKNREWSVLLTPHLLWAEEPLKVSRG